MINRLGIFNYTWVLCGG